MNTSLKRGLLCLLALVLLVLPCLLAGCGKGENPTPPVGTTGNGEAQGSGENGNSGTNTPGDSDEARYKPAKKDYDRDFTMLTKVEDFYYSCYVYTKDNEPREICDVAIWQRQKFLEQEFGITLKRLPATGATAVEQFNNSVQGGGKICDVACLTGTDSMSAAVSGFLIDVNRVKGLNLAASYWDQRIQEEYRIQDYLFTLEGDFNYIDDLRTFVTIYNDTMFESLGFYDTYGSPYELSKDGKWTYAKMMEMIKECGHIDSGKGKPELDTWGMVSECSAPYYYFLGSGMKMLKNEGGKLSLSFESNWDLTYSTIEDYLNMDKDSAVVVANRPNSFSDSTDIWTTASDIFQYNRVLFRSTSLSAVLRLLDMKDDYGIMPIPAYTEGQDGYYCWVDPGNHFPMTFPVTSWQEIDEIGEMAEVLGYYSLYGADSLNIAFYDLLAYARLCRRPEDKKMLQLVFANKTYDIDLALKISGTFSAIYDISYNKSYDTLSTSFTKVRDSAGETMKKRVSELVANLAKQNLN